jgi:hypothetical protein
MGYIIGNTIVGNNYQKNNTKKLVTSNLEEEFKAATEGVSSNVPIKVDPVDPVSSVSFTKIGDRIIKRGSTLDVTRNAPLFNDPRYTSSTLAIPTDDRTLHGLYRFFADTDPIVGAAIRIHTELPVANLQLGECEDSGVQAHFEEMADRINLIRTITDGVKEYWTIGNDYFFGAWNEKDYMWDQFTLLNPDYVKVESTWLNQKPLIKLIPDESLKKIVQTRSPDFLYKQLSPEIIRYVLYNNEIPLHPNNVFILSHDKAPYEVKGKSIIKRLLKILMYEDRLQQAQFAIATRHIVPLTVVKVGDPNSLAEDHYVTYKDSNNTLFVETFEDIWNRLDGQVIFTDGGKEIKDIRHHNLCTQTVDENGIYKWSKIDYILRHRTPEDMLKISTPVGTLTMTTSHGLMWVNPETGVYEHVTPEELLKRTNPTIISHNIFNYSIDSNTIFGQKLTTDLAYFIGLWTADGYIRRGSSLQLRVSNTNQQIVNTLFKSSCFEYVSIYRRKNRNELCCYCKNPDLANELDNYYSSCKKTGNEKLPNELLFNASSEVVGALFAGIFDGDGNVSKRGKIVVSTSQSRHYSHMLSLALLAKGIVTKVSMRIRKPRIIKGRTKTTIFEPVYDVSIVGQYRRKFVNLVLPFVQHDLKKERLEALSNDLKCQNVDVHDIDSNLLSDDDRIYGEKVKSYYDRTKKRISINILHNLSETDSLSKLKNLFGVAVKNIEEVTCDSTYVYDLMLEKDSAHCYLAAGEGWVQTSNTGWVPEQSELESLRDMFAAWELDPNFCYDEETECLTKDGWIHYTKLTPQTEIATFNSKTNAIEYQRPSVINIQDYVGDMIHFESLGIDIKVTPNHRMWVKRGNEEWGIKLAEEVERRDQFRAVVDGYEGDDLPEYLEIAGKHVKTEDWFEFAGWYLSEGSSYFEKEWNCNYSVTITQKKKHTQNIIRELFERLPWSWNLHGKNFTINNKQFATFVVSEFGKGSNNKRVPRWMLNAKRPLLDILLKAWLAGDGHQWQKKDGDTFMVGASVSEQLVDDMQEVAFKLGYATKKSTRTNSYRVNNNGDKVYVRENGDKYYDIHILHISKGKKLSYPRVPRRSEQVSLNIPVDFDVPKVGKRVDWYNIDLRSLFEQCGGVASTVAKVLKVDKGTVCSQLKKLGIERKKAGSGKVKDGISHESKHTVREQYNGKIWCVTVPNGIIVTRRKGKVAVQGQSIFYHYGINVEFYGSTGKILPVGPEFDRVYKLKFIGLGIHEQLMTGAGGSYAQAYANLEIQRQRYLNLQLKIDQMVHVGWFKTVSEMCGFYRISQPVVGNYYRGKKYGSVRDAGKDLMKQYSGIRDYQDNKDFREFFYKKAQELKNQELTQRREYIYPKLDWGAMSATNDENYKNWIKWLKEKVPWMVDEALLARISRLDITAQEKAYFRDIERRKRRETEIIRKGLAPWVQEKKSQGPIAGDFGEPTSMDIGIPGGMPEAPPAGGGLSAPEAPIGAGGPPEGGAAAGEAPAPPPTAASRHADTLEKLSSEMFNEMKSEVDITLSENRPFLVEHATIDAVVGKNPVVK